ncbi:unnamed protein product [Ceutorhynchus assimilis]|uniref:Mab-21-like HhH/H2TH-like domain-containing protein n=1 Tax=Ceutorhynchus assimilis TaxID=467358 RepID=A0A9N9N352_9CUCU|nr:unnamed protein product [Ceutorhynchus assimilis]
MFRSKDRSRKNVKLKMDELVLPNSKLKFCVDQLQNLNFIFNKRLERSGSDDNDADHMSFEKSILLAKSVAERLMQRLLCGAAQIDERFASKFLINNRVDHNNTHSTHLEYLVRLDALSTPLIYPTDENPTYEILETDKDCPAGYARIRLNSPTHARWEEFINSFGFLRRDRIQAKFVELLAQAAGSDLPSSPLQVDESTMCGTPGKIVDPATMYHILKVPAKEQVFYGPGGGVPRFPDTRDFRLAIVDEPNGIKLKIEFLSPALSQITIKVTILVAIGVDAWPAASDFPARVPLGHSDCLLTYQAAQTGMYLVGYGVHSSAWQVRLPAAEFVMLNYYGPSSTVRTILDILYEVLHDINNLRRYQKPTSYKILNRYMLFTLLMEALEENSTTPFADMLNWSPMYLSSLVLKLLDRAISRLTSEFQPNYFFKKANLLVNPGHLSDDDFIIEANNLKNYLLRLFDESLTSNKTNEDFANMLLAQETELSLIFKWKNLVEGLVPPKATRSRRLCFAGSRNSSHIAHTQYTARQLEYIGLLLHNMLKVRKYIWQPHNNELDNEDDEHYLEDIIFVLVALLDQARDQYLSLQNPNIVKIKANYSNYVSKLIDLIRKDKEFVARNLHEDQILVKLILKWLYKAMDQNKKYFAPILRPYLNNVFSTSHHVSFHLELIKERSRTDELQAIGSFCNLVNEGSITPAQGLMDSFSKHWQWAKDMLGMIEKNTLRLVFVQERGKVYRHILSLPSYSQTETNGSKTWSAKRRNVRSIERRSTLPGRNYFNSLLESPSYLESPQHEILKLNSPLTLILSRRYRLGQHRCAGDLFKTMAAMQKLSVFREATSSLAKEDQLRLLNIIENIHTAKAKKSLAKKWSSTLPQSSKINPFGQKYTPVEESAGIRIAPEKSKKVLARNESLLDRSRAARLREDNNVFLLQENFRITTLVNRL